MDSPFALATFQRRKQDTTTLAMDLARPSRPGHPTAILQSAIIAKAPTSIPQPKTACDEGCWNELANSLGSKHIEGRLNGTVLAELPSTWDELVVHAGDANTDTRVTEWLKHTVRGYHARLTASSPSAQAKNRPIAPGVDDQGKAVVPPMQGPEPGSILDWMERVSSSEYRDSAQRAHFWPK